METNAQAPNVPTIPPRPVYSRAYRLASVVDALARCEETPATHGEWIGRHKETLARIMATAVHGSGIDGNVTLDRERSNRGKIVIHAEVHRMDGNGSYNGWRTCRITIRPAFHGIDVDATGAGLADYLDWICDAFRDWASEPDDDSAQNPPGALLNR